MATQAQLQSDIHRCNNQISDANSRIRQLEKKLEDYQEGLKRHYRTKNSFDEYMHEHQTSANKTSEAASAFKFAQGFSIHMADILTGRRRQSADNSFFEMEAKMRKAIANTEDEIAREKQNVYNLNNRLSSLQHQLRQLLAND